MLVDHTNLIFNDFDILDPSHFPSYRLEHRGKDE